MSRAYDIAEKLKNGSKKPTVKIDETHIYEINISKNVGIFLKGLTEDSKMDDFEKIDKIIEAGIGKEALEYIDSLDLPIASYVVIVNVIMAAINDVSLEEIEEIEEMEVESTNKNNNFRKKKRRK
ncbi:hypothetical protein QX51_15250 [Terrisporobacter othiniensis]|uniref:Uncharacterized protein n=1 Tax=Terrisporobacter othiniensis TaxID=1577792 RepID=A0A0B3WNL5_9FIRM|nr:hypothetical protein [Terrisporobacter othiniensis]KHS56125.1 hypothetical protein QX51_15250 [Terrisporobacter othiniensis]